ncbi:MAG: Fe-S cluster assembly protein SufD [Bacteroidota bacterium]
MDGLRYISKVEDEYFYLYQDNREIINKNIPEYIQKIRDDAIIDFTNVGISDKSDEESRHTDFKAIFSNDFRKNFNSEKYDVNVKEVFQCNVPELDTHLILLINGRYYEGNNALSNVPEGVILSGLAEAFIKYPEILKKHYTKYAKTKENGLTALNTVFAQDGFFLYIPENTILDKSIQVINILRANENRMVQQRNLIVLEDHCEAKIVICDHTLSDHKYLTNNITEIYTGRNSVFDIYNMQDEHNLASKVNSIFINQEEGSNVFSNTISLHGGIIRNNIHVLLNGKKCENHTYGIFLSDKSQHIDNHTFIDHAFPECTSSELFKGIMDDTSTAAFSGRILVRKDAQKSQAFQSNNNIMLTDTARINTRPQLEIYADDVKCSHGATVGQLDEDAMFYIRSRGIDMKEARMLLMFAFAKEVINKIRILPLQERIDDLIEKRLRGELTRCANCAVNCYQDNN